MQEPIQPPVSYDDFNFSLDPAVSSIFPSPPPLPPSADLFSQSETTDLLGFLDNFGFDLDDIYAPQPSIAPADVQHTNPPAQDVPMTLHSALTMSMADKGKSTPRQPAAPAPSGKAQSSRSSRSSRKAAAPAPPANTSPPESADGVDADGQPKQLLSTPQKRLNHIMSEQKRRNAIRDGYLQLTTLLAPAGAPPGAGMPTRGRPKGSGTRGGGRGGRGGFKGKSGILFRAVEYIHWLEEGRDALMDEVLKVEAAAGIHHS